MPPTRLDWPALEYPPEHPASGPVVDGGGRECMVKFRDKTWRLCRADAWQRDGDTWRVKLRWGVSGQWHDGWYVYDPERIDGQHPA